MATPDAAYAAAVQYIFSNADFSGQAKRYQNPHDNWARFDRMLELIGRPEGKLKIVHIAGTNGKGTNGITHVAIDCRNVCVFATPERHAF